MIESHEIGTKEQTQCHKTVIRILLVSYRDHLWSVPSLPELGQGSPMEDKECALLYGMIKFISWLTAAIYKISAQAQIQ